MNKKRNVKLMYAIIFLQGFVFYGPVATLFRQARGLAMSEIFIIETISWIVLVALEVPWGWISDRFGYKKTLIIVNVVFVASKIVFYMSHSFESFLIERILLAIVFSGLSGCDSALIYASIDESEAQNVFGKYSAFGTLGLLIASILSSFIVSRSLENTALFTIFPYVLAAMLTFFLVDIKVEKSKNVHVIDSFKTAFSDKSIILFVVSIALIIEVFQAVTVFLNQLQYVRSGIDPKYFGVILAVILGMGLFADKASKVSKKLGNIRAIYILNFLVVVSCMALILTTSKIISIMGIVMISLSVALMGPIENDIKNKKIDDSERVTVLSIYSMVGGLIASICNIFIGKAADYSLVMGLSICAAISVMAFILMIVYFRINKIKS